MPQCGTDPPRSQHGLHAQTDTEAEYLAVHRLHQLKIDKRCPGQSHRELATIAQAVRLGQEAAGMRGGDDTLVSAPQEDRGREKRCAPVRGGPQGNEGGVGMVPSTNQHTDGSLLTLQTLATRHNMFKNSRGLRTFEFSGIAAPICRKEDVYEDESTD
ncbi:hypothetical protein B0H14DRAFT_2580441 [Mycena olivaceomarginata]|nr:hypothetical protein B0H14DRAFT_2580441 [Mycena olivaceomarginata]